MELDQVKVWLDTSLSNLEKTMKARLGNEGDLTERMETLMTVSRSLRSVSKVNRQYAELIRNGAKMSRAIAARNVSSA